MPDDLTVPSIPDVTAPLADEDPCGPDLDLAGDPDFLNFLARMEGELPTQFFSGADGRPFDRSTIDFAAEAAAAHSLLQRSRDLRLLTLLAKLSILNRDLGRFVEYLGAIATLVETRWDEVNPRAEEGDYSLRIAALQSLDDAAPVVLPVQHVPLVAHPRLGPLTYRLHMTAAGEIAPRDGEEPGDPNVIDRIGAEVDAASLRLARDRLAAAADSLARVRKVCVDQIGHDRAVRLERLPGLLAKMLAFVDGLLQRRGDARGSGPSGSGAEDNSSAPTEMTPAGRPVVDTVAAASASLAAVAGYFAQHEPSSPALLLARQAERLVGRSFVEVMQVLVPTLANEAVIGIGGQHVFDLSLSQLSGLDGESSPPRIEPTAAEEITTREAALQRLSSIAAFYTRSEPSSPIPYLVNRAANLATRDFISILKDILPENSLRSTESGAAN